MSFDPSFWTMVKHRFIRRRKNFVHKYNKTIKDFQDINSFIKKTIENIYFFFFLVFNLFIFCRPGLEGTGSKTLSPCLITLEHSFMVWTPM